MGLAIDLKRKVLDVNIPMFLTEYEVMLVEHKSSIHYCYVK